MKKLFILSLLAAAGLANAGAVAKATSDSGDYIILSDDHVGKVQRVRTQVR